MDRAEGSLGDAHTPCWSCAAKGGVHEVGSKNTNQCPAGSSQISSSVDCEAAALSSDWAYKGEETKSGWPKGCYLYGTGHMYFNKHDVGSANSKAAPLCQKSGPTLAPTTSLKGLLRANSSRTLAPSNANPVTCRNPFVSDVESWDCACHEIMMDKCNLKGCGKGDDCFTTCYRAQLCGDPKVCQEWKEKVCCTDSDEDLNKALNRNKKHTCTDLRANCEHKEIGRLVQLHCPKTCGMCKLPHKVQTGVEADMLLDDALSSKMMAHGWTLTPISRFTHTPTDDQSCFVDPEAFDCDCYAKKRRFCGNEHSRGVHHLRHPSVHNSTKRVYSASECEHFFVCTHSQTCDSYKKTHCKQEMKLLKHLKAGKHMIDTC